MLSLASKLDFEFRSLLTMADYLAWLFLDPSKFTIIRKEKIKKILIFHLGAIGEVLASTPLLPILKEEFNAEIQYMVPASKKEILENNPYISKILIHQDDFWKNIETLKKEKYDLALVIHPSSLKTALTCLFAGIKYRIGGFRGMKDGVNLFFTRRMLDLRKRHAIQSNLDIIRTIGLDNKNPKFEFYLSKEDLEKAQKLLKKLNVKDYAIIHPGSSSYTTLKYPSRLWPPERFAEVADYLIKKHNLKILITGSPDEKSIGDDIIKLIKNKDKVINIAGKLSIRETASILPKSKVLVVPSTGVAHLATALNAKMVHLSGPDGHHWHPWITGDNCIALQHNEVCTGCEKVYCRKKTIECMKAITVSEVINAAESLLKKK